MPFRGHLFAWSGSGKSHSVIAIFQKSWALWLPTYLTITFHEKDATTQHHVPGAVQNRPESPART